MVRKGRLEEIISKALYADKDPDSYTVSYRDFNSIVEISLSEFLKISENFAVIPASRILLVRRRGEVLFQKSATSLR